MTSRFTLPRWLLTVRLPWYNKSDKLLSIVRRAAPHGNKMVVPRHPPYIQLYSICQPHSSNLYFQMGWGNMTPQGRCKMALKLAYRMNSSWGEVGQITWHVTERPSGWKIVPSLPQLVLSQRLYVRSSTVIHHFQNLASCSLEQKFHVVKLAFCMSFYYIKQSGP